jgi:hypothetical protein
MFGSDRFSLAIVFLLWFLIFLLVGLSFFSRHRPQ